MGLYYRVFGWISPYYWVLGWILTSRFMFCCQFWEENTCFLFGSKIFLSRTQFLEKPQGQRLSYSHLLSSFQLIESSDWAHIFINDKSSLMCEILICFTPELSWSLETSYPQKFLSTLAMIFDSLESVRLRKQKTPLQNVLLEHTTQYSQVKPLINVDNIWYQLILSW